MGPRLGSHSTRKPPPPKFPAWGKVTAKAKEVATAASTALPPSRRIWAPTAAAWASWAATIPADDSTGWKR